MYEKTITTVPAFRGRLLEVDVLTVELENGTRASREIVRHRGAVAVLVRRPDGKFVLVRQFRKAAEKEMIEVVAGCREKGETSEQSAIREVREETGYVVNAIYDLGKVFLAPGYSTEALGLFLTDVEQTPCAINPDDDEHITTVLLTENELDAMLIAPGEIDDGKTVALWYRYLRSPWYRSPQA